MSSRALLKDPIFGAEVMVLNGCQDSIAERRSKSWLQGRGQSIDEIDFQILPDDTGMTFQSGPLFVIWLRESFDLRTLAHEAAHVAIRMAKRIGHKIKKDDELVPYYVGFVVGEAMERL